MGTGKKDGGHGIFKITERDKCSMQKLVQMLRKWRKKCQQSRKIGKKDPKEVTSEPTRRSSRNTPSRLEVDAQCLAEKTTCNRGQR